MSTMKVNRIENTSTASGGLDIDTSGNVRVTTLADSSGSNDSTPAEIASGRAKAWVNFNGTGTVAIRDSYNVASITDHAEGRYEVVFTNAMSNINYCVSSGQGSGSDKITVLYDTGDGNYTAPTVNGFRIRICENSGTNRDCANVNASIFGD